jgi:hypothetical protein
MACCFTATDNENRYLTHKISTNNKMKTFSLSLLINFSHRPPTLSSSTNPTLVQQVLKIKFTKLNRLWYHGTTLSLCSLILYARRNLCPHLPYISGNAKI